MWRGSWGRDIPKEAVVERIGINFDPSTDESFGVEEVEWCDVGDTVVLDLDNGHWAYGSQIEPMPTDEDIDNFVEAHK